MLATLLLYCFLGSITGVLAGLLGVGGGLVIVPMLVVAFNYQQIHPEIIMHLAIGTSLATIIFTSISSFMAHHKRGAVLWQTVRRITIGILTGTFIGSCFVSLLSTEFLKAIFVVFLYFVAYQFLTNKKPNPSKQLPGMFGMFISGNIIGFISSMVGIGGGILSVPFMIWRNVIVHQAIGTSSAIGLPIAIAGTVGFIYTGWNNNLTPTYSLGFVYLPALLGIAALSVLTAPFGVKLAHNLPVGKLKKIFAVLLIVVGTRMLISVF